MTAERKKTLTFERVLRLLARHESPGGLWRRELDGGVGEDLDAALVLLVGGTHAAEDLHRVLVGAGHQGPRLGQGLGPQRGPRYVEQTFINVKTKRRYQFRVIKISYKHSILSIAEQKTSKALIYFFIKDSNIRLL